LLRPASLFSELIADAALADALFGSEELVAGSEVKHALFVDGYLSTLPAVEVEPGAGSAIEVSVAKTVGGAGEHVLLVAAALTCALETHQSSAHKTPVDDRLTELSAVEHSLVDHV